MDSDRSEQLQAWVREADEYADWFMSANFQSSNKAKKLARDRFFARLVEKDALERAAKAIRRRNEGRHPLMVSERVEAEKCAKAIEALAAAEREGS